MQCTGLYCEDYLVRDQLRLRVRQQMTNPGLHAYIHTYMNAVSE